MNFTNIVKTYDGDELRKFIIDPLVIALTTMNRYSVLPVYMLQFVITKAGLIPNIILTAYEDRNLLIETSSFSSHLEEIMHDKAPKTAAQTIIVYPEGLNYSDVILDNSDKFYYSSTYLVSGKELKDNIKNGRIDIFKLDLVSDLNRTSIKSVLSWRMVPYTIKDPDCEGQTIIPEVCIGRIPSTIKLFQSPFINYSEITKKYQAIISGIINVATNPLSIVIDDEDKLKTMFNDVKDKQMIDIPDLNGVKIFKDFVKTKPNRVTAIASKEKYNDDGVTAISVYFNMYFKSSHYNVGVFYRYIDAIFNSLNGSIEED